MRVSVASSGAPAIVRPYADVADLRAGNVQGLKPVVAPNAPKLSVAAPRHRQITPK
jgi:hypothetical protein